MERKRLGELRICFVFLCLIGVSVLVVAAVDDHHGCDRVKENYLQHKFGPAKDVPNDPLPESDLSVCFNGFEPGKSCCSKKMEKSYKERSESALKRLLQERSLDLIDMIVKVKDTFDHQVTALIQKAKSNTLVHLTDIYRIPRNEHEHHVEELFQNLAKYSKPNVTIGSSVTKFFDNLLPLVFRYTVNDPSVTNYKESLNDCLLSVQTSLQPPPFGPFVRKLIYDLSLAFRAPISYQEALSDFIDLINQTNKIKLEETCKEGLTQMLFCSKCKGLLTVRPCKDFCEDVLHGCFGKLMEIFSESKRVIQQFQPFLKVMKEEHGLEVVLKSVDRIISDAIMHAMDKAPEFTPMILSECKETVSAPKEQKNAPVSVVVPIAKPTPTEMETPIFLDMDDQINLLLKIFSADGVYRNLTEKFYQEYQPAISEIKCWNGSHVAQYFQTTSKYHSPNLRVNFAYDKHMLTMKDKLGHVEGNLLRQVQREHMQNDAMPDHSGGGSLYSYRDDEDYYAGSGSGSGFFTPGNQNPSSTEGGFTFDTPSREKKPKHGTGSRSSGVIPRSSWSVSLLTLFLTCCVGSVHLWS